MAVEARRVTGVVTAHRQLEGGGLEVRRPFPGGGSPNFLGEQFDPFLLLDHFGPVVTGPGEAVGAPWHPHRGFATISYLLEGELTHKDSAGNAGTLRPGDFQLMVAGAGIIHDESPSAYIKAHGGRQEGFQIWVNLKAEDKMCAPTYQDFGADEVPTFHGENFVAKVASGTAFGLEGPAQSPVPIHFVDVHATAGAVVAHDLPKSMSLGVYVYRGRALFFKDKDKDDRNNEGNSGNGDVAAEEGQFVVLGEGSPAAEGGAASTRALVTVPDDVATCQFLILAGEPLREPMARYGPFVMNTNAQIAKAYTDYNAGNFGNIPATFKSRTIHHDTYDPERHKLV
mmetsp:Transcript_8564/g.28066  ORF Transcript_8564/g.28066 Transcript_8564/m.28066 type:complete len:341 (+) Transcript_8564:163-1185(+)